MNETVRIVRQEMDRQRQVEEFWDKLHSQYPITRGHQELGRSLLNKNMAKMADMSGDEGVRFLGDALTKEIARRQRRDELQRDASAYAPGPMGSSGHSFNPATGETVEGGAEYDHEPRTFGDIVKERRAARRAASSKYYDVAKDDSTKRRRASYAR